MSIFFSAASTPGGSAIARALTAGVPLRAANDNSHEGESGEELLHSALRHFAEHGMSAARLARENAEAAMRSGEENECRHWLGICRALDRRMGATAAISMGISGIS